MPLARSLYSENHKIIMPDWISQFTSSYASSIAYGLTALAITLLVKPFSIWISRFTENRVAKQKRKLVLPTEQEMARFSAKPKVTESEWKEAIEFLKNDIEPFSKRTSEPNLPGERIISHLNKNIRSYQSILGVLIIANFIANILKNKSWYVFTQFIFATALIGIVLAILTSYVLLKIHIRQEKSKFNKIKNQIRDAVNIISPKVVFTYRELGEILKNTSEKDLPRIQNELADIGFSFSIDDMRFAQLLATAPADKLIPIGQRIVSGLKQLDSLPIEKKDEFAQILVDTLRQYPVKFKGAFEKKTG